MIWIFEAFSTSYENPVTIPMARSMAAIDLATFQAGGLPASRQMAVSHDPKMAEKIRLNTTSTVAVSEINNEIMNAMKPKVNQALNR